MVPHADALQFVVPVDVSTVMTKRTLLSDVAKLFDPLGLVVIVAKVLLQRFWTLGTDSDTQLPDDLATT